MNKVCNDNIIYYYILNIKKIVTASEVISIALVIFMLILFLIHFKKHKENHTLRKDFMKGIIVLIISFLIPLGLDVSGQYIANNTDYSACLEDEEIKAIEETSITPPEYVEVKKEKKEEVIEEPPLENEEIIEIVEEEGGLEQGTTEENPNTLDITNQENAIYFLNVGAGTEAFIIQNQGHFGLIDTSYNSKASFILKQLKKLGAKELDFLIITHAHLDHIGGYSKIISSMNVNTLYIKYPGNVNSDYVATYHDLVNQAEDKGTTICDVKDEICQNFDLGYTNIQLYNTEFFSSKGIDGLNRSRVENANSLVAVATVNGRRIYFASDIGDYFDLNRETITAQEIGDIDVYKASHHGYVSYNNSLTALSYLKPEYTIITSTKELSNTSLNRIKNTSPDYKKTYYTTNGTVILHVDMDGTMKFTQ